MDAVKIACWRIDDWTATSSADLATAVAQPAALDPLTLTAAFGEAVAGGAVVAELAQMWKYSEFISTVRANLQEGDLAGVQNMILSGGLMEEGGNAIWSQTTVDALTAVVTTHTLRLVDVVAAELGETAPETVSEADVDEALGR